VGGMNSVIIAVYNIARVKTHIHALKNICNDNSDDGNRQHRIRYNGERVTIIHTGRNRTVTYAM